MTYCPTHDRHHVGESCVQHEPIPQPVTPSGWFWLDAVQVGTVKVSLERNRVFLTDSAAKGDIDQRHYLHSIELVEDALKAINRKERE